MNRSGMRKQRHLNWAGWFILVTAALLGGFALGDELCFALNGYPAEQELTCVEGVPEAVVLGCGPGGHPMGESTAVLRFTVVGTRITYTGDRPKYPEVLAAVQSGERLSAEVSTKWETLGYREGCVPLYQLRVGDRSVLTHDQVILFNKARPRTLLIFGCVVLSIFPAGGIVWLVHRLRQPRLAFASRRSAGRLAAATTAAEADGREKKIFWGSILMSVVLYAIIIAVNFDPKCRDKQIEAFGAEPLGLPVTLVVFLVQTVLYLPMPWVFWHAMRLAFQAVQDGRGFGMLYVLLVGHRHPQLRRSQMVCVGGTLYGCAIALAWIAYTAYLGI
jgi:hypothetical protein